MNYQNSKSSIWSLSATQLAGQCRLIAESASAAIDPPLQAEARRLYDAWKDALAMPETDFDARERKASQQAGLRKRTIEILVKIAGQQPGNP